ncbi:DUF1559 family PulG-like putative transporter [Paludisphaera mucosa]|uniref:DUF1559 domain-containing protein n=1 Tax=Paludisphaera mucosa TaxID=3030827 RepID=A0ABT6FLI4_9BACT|nr:DUF1559 domain-containing protein [Paludisphaera mucosa]MDG3008431.1 DUF1559 domain-containing protein [Paludisphaera mucosa]
MTRSKSVRRGFTLIELLAAILIVAVLLALLLPAVQASREAARRIQCVDNLKQIGTALNSYATFTGGLPPGRCWNGYSFYAPLLPHLDQAALYDSLNMSVHVSIAHDYPAGTPADAHRTASLARLGVLACPSDRRASWNSGTTNYAGNLGHGRRGTPGFARGVFFDEWSPQSSVTRLAEIADGASNTVAVSEWVLGAGLGAAADFRGNIYDVSGASDFDGFVAACDSSVGVRPVLPNGKRCYWLQTGLASTLYNHNQGVGMPSCDDGTRSASDGSWTAASRHPGGAAALAVDGHVAFVGESTAREIWRALGTRAGGEVVPPAE